MKRIIIPKFAEVENPLPLLARKDREFKWGPSQQEAFNSKVNICKPPILIYSNFKLYFILTMDAYMIAFAAVLSYVQDEIEWSIGNASRQMKSWGDIYSRGRSNAALSLGDQVFSILFVWQ
jgi:hypothetical protein